MMQETIQIIDSSSRVESLFEPFKEVLGDDYPAYRGHVYRIITYAMHFLGGQEQYQPIVETAFVYHDIGLWADRNLAYLEPSEARALADNDAFGWGFDPRLLKDIIHWHHKVFAYSGPNADVINACRKADWIDATGGLIRKGLSKEQVRTVEAAIPNYGFGDVLQRLARDLGGNAVSGNMKVLSRVFKI